MIFHAKVLQEIQGVLCVIKGKPSINMKPQIGHINRVLQVLLQIIDHNCGVTSQEEIIHR